MRVSIGEAQLANGNANIKMLTRIIAGQSLRQRQPCCKQRKQAFNG
jgi:hypothetical protein